MGDRVGGVLLGLNYSDPVVKYRGEKVRRLYSLMYGRGRELPELLGVDLFYSFYLPAPVVSEAPREGLELHWQLISSLLGSPKFHRLRAKTVLDSFTSSIAASSFAHELMKSIEEGGREEGGGAGAEALRRAVDRALDRISGVVESAKAVKSLVQGSRAGTGSSFELEEAAEEVVRLARNAEVGRILKLLEGLKPWMVRPSEDRQRHKHGEYGGYELGRDVERIVPSNLALPDDLFYLRYAESKLLLYSKSLARGKGPVYVLLDKSGSMDGQKMVWAKAVALALYMRASKEFRDFYIRFFDSITYPLLRVSRRAKPIEAVKVVDHLARVRGGGGTDISRAIITATTDLRTGRAEGVSDVVIITDGVDRIAEQHVVYNLRKANARLISVLIMGDNKSLMKVSHKYFRVERLSSEDILRVVEAG